MIKFDPKVAQNALNGLIMAGRVSEPEVRKVASAAEAFFEKLRDNTHDEVIPTAVIEDDTKKPSIFNHPSFLYGSPRGRATFFTNTIRGLALSKTDKQDMKELYLVNQEEAYRSLAEKMHERAINRARENAKSRNVNRFFGMSICKMAAPEKAKFQKIMEMMGAESALIAVAEYRFAKEYPWAT